MRLRYTLLIAFCVALPGRFAAQAATVPSGGATETPSPPSPAGTPLVLDDDPAPYLGSGLAEVFARFGPPATVFPLRGAEAWQDDVVFSYQSGVSLFWFGDRLWQIRFAPPYAGSIYGLFLGDAADKVYSLLGQPWEAADEALVYRLPYQGYPVRLRLAIKEGRLVDAYLYRADF